MSMSHAFLQPFRTVYGRALFHVGRRVRNRHVLAAVARHAPPVGRLLDAGCGAGGLALALARRHDRLEVEGLELDAEKVAEGAAEASRLGLHNLHLNVGDITRVGRHDRYDLAVSVDVLEHVDDDTEALASIAGALRPGGMLILHVPRSSPRRFFRVLDDHHQDDHVRDGYEPTLLADQLRNAGFADVTIKRTFGAAGELAWEVMQLVRRGNASRTRELLGVSLSPILALLCELDFRFGGGKQGNGLLVIARRGQAHSLRRAAGAGLARETAATVR